MIDVKAGVSLEHNIVQLRKKLNDLFPQIDNQKDSISEEFNDLFRNKYIILPIELKN